MNLLIILGLAALIIVVAVLAEKAAPGFRAIVALAAMALFAGIGFSCGMAVTHARFFSNHIVNTVHIVDALEELSDKGEHAHVNQLLHRLNEQYGPLSGDYTEFGEFISQVRMDAEEARGKSESKQGEDGS